MSNFVYINSWITFFHISLSIIFVLLVCNPFYHVFLYIKLGHISFFSRLFLYVHKACFAWLTSACPMLSLDCPIITSLLKCVINNFIEMWVSLMKIDRAIFVLIVLWPHLPILTYVQLFGSTNSLKTYIYDITYFVF